MTETELSDIRAHSVKIEAEVSTGNISSVFASVISERIIQLNHAIDLAAENKDSHYYNMVECSYGFYRMLDKYFY